jgi:hypothetical protein
MPRIEAVPAKFRTLYRKALDGELSPRQAIKAKCQECCGWEDLHVRVARCTVRTCPLWPLRPYQEAQEARQGPHRETSGTEPGPDNLEAGRSPMDAQSPLASATHGSAGRMLGGDLIEGATPCTARTQKDRR